MWADESAGAITAALVDTEVVGWHEAASANVITSTTPITPVVTKVDVTGKYQASRPNLRRMRVDLQAFKLGANQAEGKLLRWAIKVDGHRDAAIRQHAGDTDIWAQSFRKGTGTHTVEIVKNGVSQRAYKVRTR